MRTLYTLFIATYLLPILAVFAPTARAAIADTGNCIPLFHDQRALPAPKEQKLLAQYSVETIAQRTEELQKAFAEMYDSVLWTRGDSESEMDFRRLIDKSDWDKADKLNPLEIYGEEAWLAFREADYYLKNIPQGEFRITPDIVKETHRRIIDGVFTGWRKLHFAGLPKTIFKQGGALKTRRNYGFWSLFHDLSEKEYQGIISNPDIKFIELPGKMSAEGKRRGLILYSRPEEAAQKLQELCDWVNEALKTRDPVEVAAIFQRRFVAIHPFQDGNGRTSRILMDRILLEKDIAPPLLERQDLDLFSTEQEWIAQVRKGARNTTKILDQQKQVYAKPGTQHNLGPVGTLPNGDYLSNTFNSTLQTESQWGDAPSGTGYLIQSYLQYLHSNEFILINGQHFRPTASGEYVYDRYGVIHVLANKRWVPISDSTVKFLDVAMTSPYSQWQLAKKATREYVQQWRSQSTMIAISEYPVDSYETIRQAQDQNRVVIPSDFDKDLLISDVFKPSQTLSGALELNPKSRQTTVEQLLDANTESGYLLSPTQVLAQYQKMQMEIQFLMDDFAKAGTETQDAAVYFLKQRLENTNRWARKYFENVKIDWDKLDEKDQVLLLNLPYVDATFRYLKYTPFSEILTGEAAPRDLADSVYLLRIDSGQVGKWGIYSDAEVHRLFMLIPGVKELAAKIVAEPEKFGAEFNKILVKFGKDEKKSFLKNLFGDNSNIVPAIQDAQHSRYNTRSAEVQFKRKFIDFYLHSGTSKGSDFISLSSNVQLYRYNIEGGGSGFSRDQSAALYVVRVKKSDLYWNTFSTFNSEFEFLKESKIKKSDIVDIIEVKDHYNEINETRPLLSEAARQFYDKYFR